MSWVHRTLGVSAVLCALVLLPGRAQLGTRSADLERVESERAALLERNGELREEIALIQAELDALKTDPAELERVAREDLSLVRPGEVVFELRAPDDARDRGQGVSP